jgi:serine carboxypeptidase-like clade 2
MADANRTFNAGLLDVRSPVGHLSVFHAIASHPDPAAPLIVWMNGGPGASSLMGFFTELGPYLLNLRSVPKAAGHDDASGWTAFSNPSSWSTVGSLLVWEQPAGVGFSRCVDGCPKPWNDTTSATANLHVLLAFFAQYPAEAARDLVIAGESYAGIYVPLLAQQVLHSPSLRALGVRLRAIAVGDGCIGYSVTGACGADSLDVFVSTLERVAPGVSRASLSGVRAGCSRAELTSGRQPDELSPGCAGAMRALFLEVGDYNEYHWASPCGSDGQGNWGDGSAFACANNVLPTYLALGPTQVALNVIKPGAPPVTWQAWDGDAPDYNITVPDAQPVYSELLAANVSTLIYSGLSDTAVPDVGAAAWVPRVAGASLRAKRRKWGAPPDGQFAGHVTDYASGLSFVTVAGAGHLVPADRPVAALAMLGAWLGGRPLPAYRGKPCKRLWLGRGYGDFCGP